MRARRRDLDLQPLIPEAPFDQGRSYGVLRSRSEGALPAAEAKAMRRALDGDGEGPAYAAARVPNDKEQMPFQIVEHADDPRQVQAQSRGDPFRRQRLAASRQFANDEVPDRVVSRRHEIEQLIHAGYLVTPRTVAGEWSPRSRDIIGAPDID
jgi:hypothetical protein